MFPCLSFLICKMDGAASEPSAVLNVSTHKVLRTLWLLTGTEDWRSVNYSRRHLLHSPIPSFSFAFLFSLTKGTKYYNLPLWVELYPYKEMSES